MLEQLQWEIIHDDTEWYLHDTDEHKGEIMISDRIEQAKYKHGHLIRQIYYDHQDDIKSVSLTFVPNL